MLEKGLVHLCPCCSAQHALAPAGHSSAQSAHRAPSPLSPSSWRHRQTSQEFLLQLQPWYDHASYRSFASTADGHDQAAPSLCAVASCPPLLAPFWKINQLKLQFTGQLFVLGARSQAPATSSLVYVLLVVGASLKCAFSASCLTSLRSGCFGCPGLGRWPFED